MPAHSELERVRAMCGRCAGTGFYQYDHNHLSVCPDCCPHDQGWWLLLRHYGESNGKYCCKRGCGKSVWPSDLGIHVPEFVSPLPSHEESISVAPDTSDEPPLETAKAGATGNKPGIERSAVKGD